MLIKLPPDGSLNYLCNLSVLKGPWNTKWARTLVDSEVVANAVTCAVAVVQAHLPQRPAGQHLHVGPWPEKHTSDALRHGFMQLARVFGEVDEVYFYLWSLKEIWFEIFRCFPSAPWWRPPVGPDMQIQTDVVALNVWGCSLFATKYKLCKPGL